MAYAVDDIVVLELVQTLYDGDKYAIHFRYTNGGSIALYKNDAHIKTFE